jgi:hypothetical protein
MADTDTNTDIEIYVVIEAKYYAYEGYDFPQVLGIYIDPELARKDFRIIEDPDDRYEEKGNIFLLGPYKLKTRIEND